MQYHRLGRLHVLQLDCGDLDSSAFLDVATVDSGLSFAHERLRIGPKHVNRVKDLLLKLVFVIGAERLG